jgi:hypothetical protein
MTRRLLPIVLAGLFAAAAAPAAEAKTYCVGKPAGCTTNPQSSLADALLLAQSSWSDADTIKLGKGVFTTPSGFVYKAGSPLNALTLAGSGSGTLLKAENPKSQFGMTVLDVAGSGADSTVVKNLAVRTPIEDSAASITRGVRLTDARGENLTVDDEGGSAGHGVVLAQGARLAGAKVTMSGSNDGVQMWDSENRLEDSRIDAWVGVTARGKVSRVRIRARDIGINAGNGGASVDNASILLTGDNATGIRVAGISIPSWILASHVTIAGDRPGTTGVNVWAIDAQSWVSLDNSIIRGTTWSLARDGDNANAGVTARDSNYNADAKKFEGFGQFDELDNTNKNPGFVDIAAGDLRLKPGSPLIDKGLAMPFVASTADALGESRIVDGDGAASAAADLGAFEYQASPPAASIAAPAKVVAGQPFTLDGSGSSDPDGGDQIASWSWKFLNDGSKASGAKVTHTFAIPGTYVVELTVTDSTGRTDTALATVNAIAPAHDGGGGTEPGGATSGGTTQPAADDDAPVIAGATVRPARPRAGRAATARFSVSEHAAVVARLKRRSGGHWKTVKTVRRTLDGGTHSLRVARRLRRGAHKVVLRATDGAGNRGTRARVAFRAR